MSFLTFPLRGDKAARTARKWGTKGFKTPQWSAVRRAGFAKTGACSFAGQD